MSVLMVSEAHIRALVTAGLELAGHPPIRWDHYRDGKFVGPGFYLTPETAEQAGQMLWDANWRWYAARYQDPDHPQQPPVYQHQRYRGRLDPMRVLVLLDAYEYQCDEAPDWWASHAHQFVRDLRTRMIRRLPGFDAEPWLIR